MAAKIPLLVVVALGVMSAVVSVEAATEESALEEAALEEAALKDEPLLSASEEAPLLSALEPVHSAAVHPHVPLGAAKAEMHAIINQAITIPSHVGLEDAVTQLVMSKAEAAFGATPFGDSVKKIVDLIEKEMMPKVLEAHTADQNELDKLAKELAKCATTKSSMVSIADKSKTKYLKFSPLHKTCREGEAGLLISKTECFEELSGRKKIMDLKCTAFAMVSQKLGNQNSNGQIVKKAGSESTETYLNRISLTFCGADAKACGAPKCGSPQCGYRCQYQCAKIECEKATKDHDAWTKKCAVIKKQYDDKKEECDNLQDQMDGAACKRAVDMKDACETYAECYTIKKQSYLTAELTVKGDGKQLTGNEKDRQAEWKGLKRMQCLMKAFMDGKVETAEVTACKEKTHDVSHLVIKYPKLPAMVTCSVPRLYPTTGEYKKAEFAPLPQLAKGKEAANECTGVQEIGTKPASGSPASCKCERLTINGPYSAGPMVKCTNCLDVRKTGDKISCPAGTKLFSPRTREDWKTFLASAQPLRAPNWIIDVTRPQNGCGGCTGNTMNSGNAAQKSWVTEDASAWWLRSTTYSEPNGDYHANCYLDLWHTPKNEDSVTWNDGSCSYHSKSYYCQLTDLSTTPKKGSPSGCVCEKVELTAKYSAGLLIKCKGCLDVYRATQKNSCPEGSKLFSPRTREDWKTFIDSASPLRSPHWIIDVTQPQNGCGGCTRNAMNSVNAAQKTWRTADGSAWWLRSTTYSEPNGDYKANCYLDLWHTPPNENSVTWNDGNCNYHANSYYCQTAKKKAAPPSKSVEATCKPKSTSTADAGYTDSYRGWYDVQGCGQCMDYCRWVGNSGSGGDPTKKTTHGSSWWSCRLAGDTKAYTAKGAIKTWSLPKCGGEGAQAPAAPTADFMSRNKACTYKDTLPGGALGKKAHTVIMSLSVKTSGFSKRQWIFNLGQAGKGANHWLWNNGDKIQFGAWSGTQISKGAISKAKIVASVYDGTSYSLYIDGNLVEKKAVSQMDIKSGAMAVGTNNVYTGEDAFKGCVFGVNVYKKALSAAEIKLASSTMPTKK